ESVLRSVSVIPNEITRSIYAKECVEKFKLSESVINTQIARYRAQAIEEDRKNAERERRQAEYDKRRNQQAAPAPSGAPTPPPPPMPGDVPPPPDMPADVPPAMPYEAPSAPVAPVAPAPQVGAQQGVQNQNPIHPVTALQKSEYDVIKYMVKYGCRYMLDYEQVTVVEWLTKEIRDDNLQFTTPLYQKMHQLCLDLFADFVAAFSNFSQGIEEKKQQLFNQEIEAIRATMVGDFAEIERKEEEVRNTINEQFDQEILDYRKNFFFKHLSSHPSEQVRNLVNEICLPKHSLSKIHSESAKGVDQQRLVYLVSTAIFNWKLSIIECNIQQLYAEMKVAQENRQMEILKQIQELNNFKITFAKLTGERVVTPKNLR
ncbi:MAG: hypothetical protein Q4B68_10710, partial [Bacteroidales bacterium]|nr:hypothetical protein [Bacteroidales bacterium]